ncbi:MAG: hypothetical protein IAE90_05115 [Ignavibacteria bacterium]|nr:hypothetical protein [Ignavibacteria bacterium]
MKKRIEAAESKPVSKRSGKNTRGYRLKPSTHMMIVKIQNLLGSDQDEVIAAACTMLFNELQKNGSSKE